MINPTETQHLEVNDQTFEWHDSDEEKDLGKRPSFLPMFRILMLMKQRVRSGTRPSPRSLQSCSREATFSTAHLPSKPQPRGTLLAIARARTMAARQPHLPTTTRFPRIPIPTLPAKNITLRKTIFKHSAPSAVTIREICERQTSPNPPSRPLILRSRSQSPRKRHRQRRRASGP